MASLDTVVHDVIISFLFVEIISPRVENNVMMEIPTTMMDVTIHVR